MVSKRSEQPMLVWQAALVAVVALPVLLMTYRGQGDR
jgi:hypothetical protein